MRPLTPGVMKDHEAITQGHISSNTREKSLQIGKGFLHPNFFFRCLFLHTCLQKLVIHCLQLLVAFYLELAVEASEKKFHRQERNDRRDSSPFRLLIINFLADVGKLNLEIVYPCF